MNRMVDFQNNRPLDRRTFLGTAMVTCAIAPPLAPWFMQFTVSLSSSLNAKYPNIKTGQEFEGLIAGAVHRCDVPPPLERAEDRESCQRFHP